MLTTPLDQPVSTLVHAPVVDVHGTATLRQAAVVLAENQIGLLVVRRGALAVGVLSERDLVRAAAEGADLDDMRVSDMMSEDLAGVQSQASVREALRVMSTNGIRHLLVRAEGHVVGVLSARDVLGVLDT
jgi:CBS domain-containing protein